MPGQTNPKNDPGHRSLATVRGSSRVAAVVIGLLLALGAIALFQKAAGWDEPCGRSWSTDVNVRGDATRVSLRSGRCRLEAEIRGEVHLSPEEDAVAFVGPGGHLEIEHLEENAEGERVEHELLARPGDSAESPDVVYRRNDRAMTLDATGRAWLGRAAKVLYRRAGLDAEARARRIWERGGADALVAEAGAIGPDHVAATYLLPPLRRGDARAVARTLEAAAGTVGSDHYLADLLEALAGGNAPSEENPRDTDAGNERWNELLADPAAGELRPALLRALEALESDYEQRRAIAALLRSLPVEPAAEPLEDVLLAAAAEGLGSDYEAAELVQVLATRIGGERPLPPPALRLLEGIGGDFELRRALVALVERDPPADDRLALVQLAARRIGSDFELTELLLAVLRRDPGPRVEAEIRRSLAAVGSDHERRRVERALEG